MEKIVGLCEVKKERVIEKNTHTERERGRTNQSVGMCQLSLSSWSMCLLEEVAGGNQQHRILDFFPILLLNGTLVHVFSDVP